MKKLYIGLWFLLLHSLVLAQTGTVRGTIIDVNTGESVPFANVLITETNSGFTTDLDGTYSYNLLEGIYTFRVSYVGYSNYKIENVVVQTEKITIVDIAIKQDKQVLQEVVVEARQFRNTENAVLTTQRKSMRVVNGISAQSFRKTGDNNAGSAIKRVTGVSVNEGKYVFVRGLGDRYSKTTLNNMDIPGLDPNRNSIQMDIFPTNILDNIIVSKTATSDLPGDFTGGIINITTNDFPEEKEINISLGFSYNPDMNFKDNFPTSTKGTTDWLGIDDGMRDLNVDKNQAFSPPINETQLTILTSRFKNNMAVQQSSSFTNYNMGFSMGDQINKKKVTLGYNIAINYRNSTFFYRDMLFNNYIKPLDVTKTELLTDRTTSGEMGVDNTQLSGVISGAVKLKKHKLSMLIMHLQNGKSTAGIFEQSSFIRASNKILRDNVEYTQRSITNLLLAGNHYLSNTFTINWKFSPTLSTIRDKDIRITPFKLNDNNNLTIEPSEGAQPRRLWRNLDEKNYSSRIDLNKSTSIFNRSINVKFGVSNTYKERDYEILNYLVNVKNPSLLNLSGDPNELFLPKNIWTPDKQFGVYVIGNFEPANTYNAYQNIIGAYIMADVELMNNLKVNLGVRMEKFSQGYTGQNNTGLRVFNNEKIADNTDFLPALNIVYQIGKSMNVRSSYSNTLARPSFKEASIAQIYDALSDRTFIGNIDLRQTHINNYDIRWEMFGEARQLFSVSGFYKTFIDPIEIVAFSSSAPNNLQPRNVGNASVLGAEVEFRKSLGFISERMRKFSIGSNFTLVQSNVTLDKSKNGEYDSRKSSQREGEHISDTRPMQGQAPYMVNAIINYLDDEWDVSLSYNVQGSSLSVAGIGLNPDVYTIPYHDLSCKISKQFGKKKGLRLSVGIQNILDSDKAKHYTSHGATKQIFERYRPRRTFTLGMNWRLF